MKKKLEPANVWHFCIKVINEFKTVHLFSFEVANQLIN